MIHTRLTIHSLLLAMLLIPQRVFSVPPKWGTGFYQPRDDLIKDSSARRADAKQYNYQRRNRPPQFQSKNLHLNSLTSTFGQMPHNDDPMKQLAPNRDHEETIKPSGYRTIMSLDNNEARWTRHPPNPPTKAIGRSNTLATTTHWPKTEEELNTLAAIHSQKYQAGRTRHPPNPPAKAIGRSNTLATTTHWPKTEEELNTLAAIHSQKYQAGLIGYPPNPMLEAIIARLNTPATTHWQKTEEVVNTPATTHWPTHQAGRIRHPPIPPSKAIEKPNASATSAHWQQIEHDLIGDLLKPLPKAIGEPNASATTRTLI